MGKRHSDALFIQQGACNPSGIAHSIVDACQEMRLEPTHKGTDEITSDAAVRLMVHQLSFLCGVTTGAEGFARGQDYGELVAECERRAVESGHQIA